MSHVQFSLPETNTMDLVNKADGYLSGVGACIAHAVNALKAEGITAETKAALEGVLRKANGSQRWLMEQLVDRFDKLDAPAKTRVTEIFRAFGDDLPNALYGKLIKRGIVTAPVGDGVPGTNTGSDQAAA